MSEVSNQVEPKPQDPDLLPCQLELKQLCEEILALKPAKAEINAWGVNISADPDEVQTRLRASSIGDLLLEDGESLLAPYRPGHQPDFDLFVGQASLRSVTLGARFWEYDKLRRDPNDSDRIIHYPGEKDWGHQLDINLHYTDGRLTATQLISMHTNSIHAGELPSISRDVCASVYAEMGYDGHNQVYRDNVRDAVEASFFIDLARELFEARSQS